MKIATYSCEGFIFISLIIFRTKMTSQDEKIELRTYEDYTTFSDSFDEHKWLGENIGKVLSEFSAIKQRVRQNRVES